MTDITVTLTEAQFKSAETVMADVQEWVQNAIDVRSDIAQSEILSTLMAHCNENDIAIAVGTLAQINQAYELGLVRRAADAVPSDGGV